MNIGERIKLRRIELGMSQEELAFKMGYNGRSTIAKIESGAVEVAHTKVLQYAKILNVSVEYLMEPDEISNDNSRAVHIIVGQRIHKRRKELNMSADELAARIGKDRATIYRYENGQIENMPMSLLQPMSEVLQVSVPFLMGLGEENQKADSRDIFSKNLRLFMAKANKSRKEVSEAVGVSYFTFSDWCNGKKYPRIEKLETLAKYFGISVSELVGGQQDESTQNESQQIGKDEVLDIILRLHTDAEFLRIVEKMSALDNEKLKALKQFLLAFGE